MSTQFSSSSHTNDRPPKLPTASRGKAIHATTVEEVEDESFHSQPIQRKNTNPFRRYQEAPGLAESKAPLHDRTNRSASSSSKTNAPVKAVFDDLSTAHSLITKGSARNGNRSASQARSDFYNDGDQNAIPLQDIQTPAHHYDITSIHYVNKTPPILPALPPQSNPIFNNIKTALASMSSPITRDGMSDILPGPSKKQQIYVENMKDESPAFVYGAGGDAARSSTPYGEVNYWNEEEGNDLRSSMNYPGNDYSIYHSSLGAAPSGSAPLSSRFGESPANKFGMTPYRTASSESHFPSSASQKPHLQSTPSGHTWPRKASKLRNVDSTDGSVRDGSTVTNIYRHYAPSEVAEEESVLDKSLNNKHKSPDTARFRFPNCQTQNARSTESRLNENPTDLLRQPPAFGLPASPGRVMQNLLPSPSLPIAHSSSYGDTHKLLDITQRTNVAASKPTMSRSEGCSDLRSDFGVSDSNKHTQAQQSSSPFLASNNPFRASQSPNVIISAADGKQHVYHDSDNDFNTNERVPLERDVSKALRRASGYSSYSLGSISSSILEQDDEHDDIPLKHISSYQRSQLDNTPPSESEHVDGDTWSSVARAQAFYDTSVVADTYKHTQQHHKVRVPIEHNGSFPDSPPATPVDHSEEGYGNSNQTTEGDHHDWETVGESVLGLEIKGTKDAPGMLGGTARRAGSSIANASDEGPAVEYISEISAFDSTERIAQHPAAIEYCGDYRQRDLKKTRMPVFLPVYREHKVNGYPADSMRTRPPPNMLNRTPQALKEAHKNPFNSTPPNFVQSSSVRPTFKYRSQRPKPNHFPPTPSTVKSSLKQEETLISLASTPEQAAEDSFGEPGPAIRTNHQTLDSDENIQQSSWLQAMRYADGSWPAYDEDSSSGRKEAPARTNGSVATEMQRPEKAFTRDSDSKQYIKGSPGTFYQSLRGSRSRHDIDSRRSRRRGPREYPTNNLRPFSLLSLGSNTTNEGQAYQNTSRGEFVYRSPLAPIKRDSWKLLYTPAQLEQQAEWAKQDSFTTNDNLPTVQPAKWRSSMVHLNEPPTLFLPRESHSITSSLVLQKHRLSKLVFYLCNLFPPLLGLYAWGYLDSIMISWSRGEFDSFPRKYKRWAGRAMFIWMIAIILGLSIGLGVYFSLLPKSASS